MVTNHAEDLTPEDVGRESTGEAIVSRAMSRLGRLLCGMRGHDAVLHFEGKRLMMRCTLCGYDSPGWEIADRAPRKRFDGDARRHLLASGRPRSLRKSA
jgi:hypothetical protein